MLFNEKFPHNKLASADAKSAKPDDSMALVKLAYKHYRGEEIPKAVELLKISADKGNPYAQCLLGELYAKGDKIPKTATKRSNCSASRPSKASRKLNTPLASFTTRAKSCPWTRPPRPSGSP